MVVLVPRHEKRKRYYPGRRAGYTVTQIADLMGVSVSTAKRVLEKAERVAGKRFTTGGEVGQIIARVWEAKHDRDIQAQLDEFFPSI